MPIPQGVSLSLSRKVEFINVLESLLMRSILLLTSLLLAGIASAAPDSSEPITDVESIQVVFTPGASGYAAITSLLAKAQSSVRVSAYHFRSRTVADALIAAKKRGVDVAVIMDRRNLQSKKNMAPYVSQAGIPVWIDDKHSVTHNKYLVVDDKWVETGSFNYRDNAEFENSENLLIVHSPALARQYIKNWKTHVVHSTPATP